MNWQKIYLKQIKPKLTEKGSCLEFTGCIDSMGYGAISVGRRTDGSRRKAYVHRVSYLAHKGSIPDGLQVQHICNNQKCCNHEHLIVGDAKSNAAHARDCGRLIYPGPGESGLRGVRPQRDGRYFYWIAVTDSVNRKYRYLYRGKDFFEACCARKSYEAGL